MFGTPSRIAPVASPQLPALTATIAGGAAATVAPADPTEAPLAPDSASGGFVLKQISSGLDKSQVGSCCVHRVTVCPGTQHTVQNVMSLQTT